MSWLILFFAGALEISWAVGLRIHNGRPLLLGLTVITAIGSVVLLGVAIKQIPIGTAYAVWTGIGIAGTFIAGALLGDSVTSAKCIYTALILAGIVGLKLSGS